MLLASFGRIVSDALAEVAPDGEFASNLPVLVLCHLELDGPARPAELAELTGLSSGGISKLIDRLELAELISRRRHGVDSDHRAVIVSLTARGRRTIRQFIEIFDRHLDDASDLFDRMTDTVRTRRETSGSPGE